VQSERLVQSSDPVEIKSGASGKLSCEGFDYIFKNHWLCWVRETSDGRLQWVAYISGTGSSTSYHDSVQGRFIISRDNTNNMVHLQMNDMKPEDTARYYCVRDSH
ncbi:hypothetical protein GDO78_017982, partial [Eleutherodactylus coqui]